MYIYLAAIAILQALAKGSRVAIVRRPQSAGDSLSEVLYYILIALLFSFLCL